MKNRLLLEYNRKDLRIWAGEELAAKFFDNRSKYPAPYNNLDYWISKSSPEALADYMDNYKSKNQVEKEKKVAGSEKIYDDGRWLVVHCMTYPAMAYYGKGTKWCIAGNYPGHEGEERGTHYFNSYLESRYSGYYVFIDRKGEDMNNKWCVCVLREDPNNCDIWSAPDYTVNYIPDAPNVKGLPPVSKFIIDGTTFKGIRSKTSRGNRGDSIQISSDIEEIAKRALYNCDASVISFEQPSKVHTIETGAFAQCEEITELIIPDSVTELGNSVFLSCDKLTRLSLGSGITKLTKNLVAFCPELKRIDIKGKITDIDQTWLLGDDGITINTTKGNKKLINWCAEHTDEVAEVKF